MTTTIPLPTSSYVLGDQRASSKHLIGCYAEALDQDTPADTKGAPPNPPISLRRWPGIVQLTTTGISTDQVRGMWEMSGIQYAVIGQNLYQVSANFVLTAVNATPIPGSGLVRMTDNGRCLVILIPNSTQAWTYTPYYATKWAPITSAFFLTYGAIECWFGDTFIVFLGQNNPTALAANGSVFFNDDGRQVSGNGPITFGTAEVFIREFGTDPFYGMAVDHREIVMFGSRTSEGFVNTGNPIGTPFSSAPDTYMPYGVHITSAYSIALQANTIFWVANDLTVRYRNGQIPQRVSNPGIELVLREANKLGQLQGCYALTPTMDGHPFYIIVIPLAQRTLAYDCVTQKWFDLESQGLGNWRALCWYNGFGLQLIGDSLTGAIGYLDPDVQTEFGTSPVICAWTYQPVYNGNNRIVHKRVEMVVTSGGAAPLAQPPTINLRYSDNFGRTWDTFQPQNLGVDADNNARAVWFKLGESRSRIYQGCVTDATPIFTVDTQAELSGGKW
jgi:hypothetical protein